VTAPRVVGVKATVGDGTDRTTVGFLPSAGWWCELHPRSKSCPHLTAVHQLLNGDQPDRLDRSAREEP
jgi:hypothetical protein